MRFVITAWARYGTEDFLGPQERTGVWQPEGLLRYEIFEVSSLRNRLMRCRFANDLDPDG